MISVVLTAAVTFPGFQVIHHHHHAASDRHTHRPKCGYVPDSDIHEIFALTTSTATSRSSIRQSSTSTSPPTPPVRAAMLLHRAPLLTPTPTPFEQSYYAYTSRLRLALSNPPPLDFYYKKGSLTERRFMRSQWTRERDAFGERLAGKKVDVGDIPAEEDVALNTRTEGDVSAAGEGEGRTKVERAGAGHVYLFVKDKQTGSWGLPTGGLEGKEALHEAAVRSVTDGLGKGMDTWLVTRKPIGLIEQSGENVSPESLCAGISLILRQTFIFKSRIIMGTPTLPSTSPYSEYAWLTKDEAREVVGGEGEVWSRVGPLLN